VNTLLLSALLALSTAMNASPMSPTSGDVPKALLSRLTTGVNITRWFCYLGPGNQDSHFAKYLGDADYQVFNKLGVKFVRLCISPDLIYSGGKPTDQLSKIDDALTQLFRQHLAVIWDLHDNGQLGLDKEGRDNSGLVSFWNTLAEHYKGSHYSDLVFEIVNEPVFIQRPDDWYQLQSKVVQAIRKQDPNRTIMVSPTYWRQHRYASEDACTAGEKPDLHVSLL
jgi:aryl-phospho-beta-D-glucosidase BglC (GH1 family)